MDCKTFRNRLPAFAAGEADEEARQAMEEHMKGCEDCAIHSLSAVPHVSDADWDRMRRSVHDRLKSAPTPAVRRVRRHVTRWVELLGVAAAVLLTIGVVRGFRPEVSDGPPSVVRSVSTAPGWNCSVSMPRSPGNALVIWVTPRDGDVPDSGSGGEAPAGQVL